MKITINSNKPQKIVNNDFLDEVIHTLYTMESVEVWLEHRNEHKMCILCNLKRMFLMFLVDNEGSSYVVQNKEFSSDEGYEDFLLANGQLDEYPKFMTVDRALLKDVILEFYTAGNQFSGVNWVAG